MSTFRQQWRLVWDDGEPFEITTSARDYAGLVIETDDDGQPIQDPTTVWHIIHNACIREGVPGIPDDFDKFADALDEAAPLTGMGTGLDPTPPGLSAG